MNHNLTDLDKSLIIAYANHDMNRSKTAKHLYMSDATVSYHLDLIYTQTGVNPRSFFGLLYLLTECFGGVNYD